MENENLELQKKVADLQIKLAAEKAEKEEIASKLKSNEENAERQKELFEKASKVSAAQQKKFGKVLKAKIVDGVKVIETSQNLYKYIPPFEVNGETMELIPGINSVRIPQIKSGVNLSIKRADGSTEKIVVIDRMGKVDLSLVVKYRPKIKINGEEIDILEYLFEMGANYFEKDGVAVFGKEKPRETQEIVIEE